MACRTPTDTFPSTHSYWSDLMNEGGGSPDVAGLVTAGNPPSVVLESHTLIDERLRKWTSGGELGQGLSYRIIRLLMNHGC